MMDALQTYETYKRLGWTDEEIWNTLSEMDFIDDGVEETEDVNY